MHNFDYLLPFVGRLNERLGLRGHTERSGLLCSNKRLQRAALDEAGVAQPRWAPCPDTATAQDFAKSQGPHRGHRPGPDHRLPRDPRAGPRGGQVRRRRHGRPLQGLVRMGPGRRGGTRGGQQLPARQRRLRRRHRLRPRPARPLRPRARPALLRRRRPSAPQRQGHGGDGRRRRPREARLRRPEVRHSQVRLSPLDLP